jgi:hypothetical protein
MSEWDAAAEHLSPSIPDPPPGFPDLVDAELIVDAAGFLRGCFIPSGGSLT